MFDERGSALDLWSADSATSVQICPQSYVIRAPTNAIYFEVFVNVPYQTARMKNRCDKNRTVDGTCIALGEQHQRGILMYWMAVREEISVVNVTTHPHTELHLS